MLLGSYCFICRFKTKAELPEYKGSTFRGVFGRALKQVVCVNPERECAACLVKNQCLYVRVFETHLCPQPPGNHRLAAPPLPFVIEPPGEVVRHYTPGEPFTFNLILFGSLNHHLPYFIYAFERMGNIGLGRRINGQRGRFTLEAVTAGNRRVYHAPDRAITPDLPLTHLTVTPDENNSKTFTAIRVCLETPLRLKYRNRLKPELPFHILIRALLRRVSSLMACYDGGEPDLEYRGLVQRAQQVRTTRHNLRWADWRRYSFRQQQEMKLGGLVGTVDYEGDLDEFMPLLEFGVRTHVGKQTAFGLGKMGVEVGAVGR